MSGGRRTRLFPTFRARLTASMLVLATLVLTATSSLVYLGGRRALRATRDDALLAIARAEVASAVDDPDGALHVHDVPGMLSLPNGSGYEKFAMIKSRDGRIAVTTSNLADPPPLTTEPSQERRAFDGHIAFGNARRGEARLRAVYYPLRDPEGHDLVAVVATPDAPLEEALASLRSVLYLAVVLGVLGSAWGARGLARYLTRPLERIAATAETVGGTSLHERIPEVSSDVELRRVTDILNAMLARLEAAFTAQRRFVADASHELRSPLANVRGTLEVALRRPRTAEEYREAIDVSLGEVERLGRLVSGLLLLSRTDAGQIVLDRGPTDLAGVARRTVAAHAARADDAGIRLVLETPAEVVVVADADRVREVADNLVDNALRHAPRGSTVTLALGPVADGVRLAVTDAGKGLTPEEQAHVFDRFYRADDARERDAGGLGLGLAIARAIAESHGGRLTVTSAPGRGATFALVLPA